MTLLDAEGIDRCGGSSPEEEKISVSTDKCWTGQRDPEDWLQTQFNRPKI